MLKKLRLLAIVMVFSLIAGQLCIVNVNAAEGVGSSSEITELSGISLTGIDKPVIGKYLDNRATVRTRENISWEIPVIWTDDLGNTATIAEEGRSYTPNFIFYVPEGYTIKEMSSDGRFTVKLPDFLIQTFGEDSLVFVIDAGIGVTYITFATSLSRQGAVPEYSIFKAPAIGPYEQSSESDDSETTASDDSDFDNTDSGSLESGNSVTPSGSGSGSGRSYSQEIPEQVRIHCSQGAISLLGTEILEDLVSRIKNKLEPQAVNLLKTSFDAYNYAANTALGTQIGLYIYYEKGSVDGYKTPDSALAYVSSGYIDDIYKYVIGIDTKTIMEKDLFTGEWRYREDEKNTFCNTIVHEMMHAFMNDYTRYGMESDTNGFPTWFVEGSASAVENIYQYRAYLFQSLGVEDANNRYDDDLARFRNPVKYSGSSILNKYTDETLDGNYRYDLKWSGEDKDIGSSYVSGYLAYVYLGYMAAMYEGKSDTYIYDDNGTPDNTKDDTSSFKIDNIRFGANKILERLHNGESLDSIIKHYTTKDSEGQSIYSSTDDFQEKFIKGSDEGNPSRTVYVYNPETHSYSSTDIMGSLAFCTYYLNYLESQSKEGDWSKLANGSILNNNMDYCSPLEWDKEEESILYNIIDSGSYVASTADNDYTWNETGGKKDVGDQSHEDPKDSNSKIIDIDNSGQDEQLPAAAKTETTVTTNVSNEESADETTEENVDESSDISVNESFEETNEDTADITQEFVTEVSNEITGNINDNIPVVEEPKSDTDDISTSGLESEPVNDLSNDIIVDNIITDESDDELSIVPNEEDAIIPDNEIYIEEPVNENDDPDSGNNNEPSVDDGNNSDPVSDDSGSADEGNSESVLENA